MTSILSRAASSLLAFSLALSVLTGCGSTGSKSATASGSAPSVSSATASAAASSAIMSVSAYKTAAKTLTETDLNAAQQQLATIDMNDPEGAKPILEEAKTAFTEFPALTPPAACKEAHTVLTKGCENMVAYIDTLGKLVNATSDADKTTLGSELNQSLLDATTQFSQGMTLLESVQ